SPAAFQANIGTVGVGDLKKYHLDEHLGLGTIEIRDHLRDVLARLFVSDNEQAARLRVNRDHRVAHFAVGRVGASGGAGSASGSRISLAAESAESPAAESTGRGLSVEVNGRAQEQRSKGGGDFELSG